MLNDTEQIRNNFPLMNYIESNYNLGKKKVVSEGFLYKNCPMCGSVSPRANDDGHFFISGKGNSYSSYSKCCRGGSAIDFFVEKEHLTLAEAINKAKSIMGIKNDYVSESPRKVVEKVETVEEHNQASNELSNEDLLLIKQGIEKRDMKKVSEFVEKRGIDEKLVEKYNIFTALVSGFEKLVIPIKEDNQFKGYVARALQENDHCRYRNSQGTIIPFNREYYRQEAEIPGEKIYICEGVFDMLSIESTGAKAISLNSVSNIEKLAEDIIKHRKTSSSYEFVLALDNDKAGKDNTKKMKTLLDKSEDKINYSELEIPKKFKDVNDWLQAEPGEFRFSLKENPTNLDYLCEVFGKDLQKMAKYKGKTTGFKNLDKELNGIVPGLYVIGAISSLGKTTFVSQIADQMASKGESILFFSLEQSRFELVAKSLSRESFKLNPRKGRTVLDIMQRFDTSEDTFATLNKYSEIAQNVRIIEGNFDMNVLKMREIIEKYIRETGKKPVVVLDYLQILRPINERMTDKAQVDFNVSELKRISRDNDIPIFVICSFNRENYTATVDFKSFKESGAIEYGADVVMGLQLKVISDSKAEVSRDTINQAKVRNPREIELVCLKNRNGKAFFKCEFNFYSAYNFFEEVILS